MFNYKKSILSVLLVATIISCGGGGGSSSSDDNNTDTNTSIIDNNSTDNNSTDKNTTSLVKEFISLDKKANVEKGYLMIDGKKRELTYTAHLAENAGLAAFNEESASPLVFMTSRDKVHPSYARIIVIADDNKTRFDCNASSITHEDINSTVIADQKVYMIKGRGCTQIGDANISKDIEIKVTDSLLGQGASRLSIKDDTAYIATGYNIPSFVVISSLGTRAYNQIFDVIAEHPEVKTIIPVSVARTTLNQDMMLNMAHLMRDNNISTKLLSSSVIHGSGIALFSAGVTRTMEENASLYVSEWDYNASQLPRDDIKHQSRIKFYNEMLGEPQGENFYFFSLDAGNDGKVYKLKEEDIAEYGLLTE